MLGSRTLEQRLIEKQKNMQITGEVLHGFIAFGRETIRGKITSAKINNDTWVKLVGMVLVATEQMSLMMAINSAVLKLPKEIFVNRQLFTEIDHNVSAEHSSLMYGLRVVRPVQLVMATAVL